MESIYTLMESSPTETASTIITSEMAKVRVALNKNLFQSLEAKQIQDVYQFLWVTMEGYYKNGPPHIKVATSSTIGSILINLAPFYSVNLMRSLLKIISKHPSESILLLSCFSYLSKFFRSVELTEILSENPIFHLFGTEESDHLLALVDELFNLPHDFLLTLAEYLFRLSLNYPSNRHFPRAAAKLLSLQPERISSLITDTTPYSLIASMYSHELPILQHDKVEMLKERGINYIKDPSSKPTEIEYACCVLSGLLKSKQINKSCIEKVITPEMLKDSSTLQSLLSLPINPQYVRSLFEFDPNAVTDVGKFRCEHARIPILMNFFAQTKEFSNELIFLVKKNLDPELDTFSVAIKCIPALVDCDGFMDVFIQAITIKTSSWIQQFWILKMLQKIDFHHVPSSAAQFACKAIERCALSKSDKLHEAARETIQIMSKTMKISFIKLFVDYLVRLMDVFDTSSFSNILGLLSFVFTSIPGNWYVTFLHIENLLYEAMSLFDPPAYTLRDALCVMSIITGNSTNVETTQLFVHIAISVIEKSYEEFTGEPIPAKRTEKLSGAKLNSEMVQKTECDIAANPSVWHTQYLGVAIQAFKYLSHVPFKILDISEEDVNYLYQLALNSLCFFPQEATQFCLSLLLTFELPHKNVINFIQNALAMQNGNNSRIALAQFIVIAVNQLGLDINSIFMGTFPSDLKDSVESSSDVPIEMIQYVVRFYKLLKIDFDTKIAGNAVDRSEHHLRFPRRESSLIDIVPMPEEEEEDSIEDSDECDIPTKFYETLPDDPHNLRKYIQSISPYILLKRKIPEPLKTTLLFKTFVINSKFTATAEQVVELLEYSISHNMRAAIAMLLLYSRKNNYPVNIGKYLDTHALQSHTMFAYVLKHFPHGIAKMEESMKNYIKKYSSDDLIDFVLTVKKNNINKANAILALDPGYFVTGFSKVPKFTKYNLMNLCIFIQKTNFPPDELFALIFRIVSSNRKTHKKRLLSIRLLALFISKYGHKNPPSVSAAEEILKNALDEADTPPAVLVELTYLASELVSIQSQTRLVAQLTELVPPSLPFGAYFVFSIQIYSKSLTKEFIESALKSPIPSIALSPMVAVNRCKYTAEDTIDENITDLIFQSHPFRTHATEGAVLYFLSTIVYSKPTKKQLRSLLEYIWKNTTTSPNGSYVPAITAIFKKIVGGLNSKSSKLDRIQKYALSMLIEQTVLPVTAELIFMSTTRRKSNGFAIDSIKDHLEKNGFYLAAAVATTFIHGQRRINPDEMNVLSLAPPTTEFYTQFISAVSILQRERGTIINYQNTELTEVQKEAYDAAMTELAPFAIFIALNQEHIQPHIFDL